MNDAPDNGNRPPIADRYREVRRLGSGGMSVVVMAEDLVLRRTVALKLIAEHLASDSNFVTRFRHEALAAARLQHPNIVQVYDSGYDATSKRQFIVMEYVDGTTLSEMLTGGRRLDTKRAVAIGADACEALECAHRAGVIHRDVKPANLIVTPDGTTKLMDFGIAKAAEMTRVTQVGSVLGTVAYLSPEQAIGGETSPRSDVYSLAVVIYEMLAGRPPYIYKSITELAMKQRDERPAHISSLNPEVPVELDRTIRVALSHDPALRFATAREFGNALRSGLSRSESEFVTTVLSNPAAATQVLPAASGRSSGKSRRTAQNAETIVAPRPPLPPRPQGSAAHDMNPRQSAAAAQGASRGGGRARRWLAVGAVVLAIVGAGAAGFMLAAPGASPVLQNNVQDQIDGLRGFVQDHR